MHMPEYGTVHLLHRLRVEEMERKRRGIGFSLSHDAPRPVALVARLRRALRISPGHLTKYEPARLRN